MKGAFLSRCGCGKIVRSWGVVFGILSALFFGLFQPHALAADPSEEGRININVGGDTYKVPYFRNYPLNTRNESIRRVVIAIHGAGDDNDKAAVQYDRMKSSACMKLVNTPVPHWEEPDATDPPCVRLNTTLIMAPHFAQSNSNLTHYGLDTSTGLKWSSDGWKFGDPSLNAGGVSSYNVMDEVIEYIATSGSFPNLDKIVIAGHSAGGQYVNRYAASTGIDGILRAAGVQIKYIIANPSSYVYFTDERVYPGTMDTFITPHPFFSTLCPDPHCCTDDPGPCPLIYNDYIYGLENALNDYWQEVVDDLGIEGIKTRYRGKSVAYLLGRLDTDSCDDALDKSCGALLEGRNRLERGLIYYNYIGHALGAAVYDTHFLATIENAGHSSNRAWKSNVGRRHIFDTLLLSEYPEIFSPRGVQESPDHTYQWYAIPGASNYRIAVTDTGGGGGSFTQDVSPGDAGCLHGGLCSKRITRAVSEGTWTVSARVSTAWFDSDPAPFLVRAPAAATPGSPSGTIADHTPTFEWNAAEGATRYQLMVFNATGIQYIRWYSALDASCDCGGGTPTCIATSPTILNNGEHWWMVRAFNNHAGGAWSPLRQFTVETPPTLPNGTYSIRVRSSSKCMGLDEPTDTNAELHARRGWSDQNWSITTSGAYSIIKGKNDKCLEADDAGGGDMRNGGNVQVANCISSASANDHQEWLIERAQDGFYRLKVRSSGKCLDADNYDNRDMKECGNIQIWDCKDPLTRNSDNQEWRIEPVPTPDIEFRHPSRTSSYPIPDIKVNGSDRMIEVSRSGSLTVSLAFDNLNTIGPEADYWVMSHSSAGLFFLTLSGWSVTPTPVVQGLLLSFPPPPVELPVPLAGVPAGSYWLYFAVDTNRDGYLSANQVYLDGVQVIVTP